MCRMVCEFVMKQMEARFHQTHLLRLHPESNREVPSHRILHHCQMELIRLENFSLYCPSLMILQRMMAHFRDRCTLVFPCGILSHWSVVDALNKGE